MREELISEIGIDGGGRLFVRPAETNFAYIWRSAMEVHWDEANGWLFSPKPREWSYADWLRQIIAAAVDEYGVRLQLAGSTVWTDIPPDLAAELRAAAGTDT